MSPTVLITGAGGLLGSACVRAGGRGLGRAELDITDADAVARTLDRLQPAAVVNCAAMAKVPRAETDPATSIAVNHVAVDGLARACAARGVRLVHIGTDYSLSPHGPWARLFPWQAPAPLSAYARHKSAGEQAALAHGAVVVRVQWVYHPGHPNFFSNVLQAMARGEPVRLVVDQLGAPTPAALLAPALLQAARGGPVGAFHLACQGETSAFGWLTTAARFLGLDPTVVPIRRSELGDAVRPARSVLDSGAFAKAFGIALPAWDDALRDALADWRP